MCFMPFYKNASYAGETVLLRNADMSVEFHKRLTGWFNNRRCLPQPVFASPYFIDRRRKNSRRRKRTQRGGGEARSCSPTSARTARSPSIRMNGTTGKTIS
jgi:hypothetical protein